MTFALKFIFSLAMVALSGLIALPFLLEVMRGAVVLSDTTPPQTFLLPILAVFAGVGGFASLASLFYSEAKTTASLFEKTADELAEQLINTYETYREHTRRALSIAIASIVAGLVAIIVVIAGNLGLLRPLNVEPNANTAFLTSAAAIVTEFVGFLGLGLFKMTSSRLKEVSDRLHLLLNLMAGVNKAREAGHEDIARAMLIKYYRLRPASASAGTEQRDERES
jgi:hypothetical protein